MLVKLVERDVQSVWLKAGQKCFINKDDLTFIGDIYSVTEASTTIADGLQDNYKHTVRNTRKPT